MAQPLTSKCRGGIQGGQGQVERGLPHELRGVYTVPSSLHSLQLRYREQTGRRVRVIEREREVAMEGGCEREETGLRKRGVGRLA